VDGAVISVVEVMTDQTIPTVPIGRARAVFFIHGLDDGKSYPGLIGHHRRRNGIFVLDLGPILSDHHLCLPFI